MGARHCELVFGLYKNLKKTLLMLSVMTTPAIVISVMDNNIASAEYKSDGLFYKDNKLGNWWYDDGKD